eukprot:scaffold7.g3487.t1
MGWGAAASALQWVVNNLYREKGDCLHLVYVVKCLMPDMEVFHGPAGSSYSFRQPDDTHREAKLIAAAKAKLEARLLPVLRQKMAHYTTHLFAANVEAAASKVGDVILRCADEQDAAMVVIAAHNKPSTPEDRTFTGSVAQHIIKSCKRPLAVCRPEQAGA